MRDEEEAEEEEEEEERKKKKGQTYRMVFRPASAATRYDMQETAARDRDRER